MTISFALFCIILRIGAANAYRRARNTTQCHSCLEDNFLSCANKTVIQNCTSPTTDSCFSAAGRYTFTSDPTVVHAGVARGCGYCPNVTEGCKSVKRFFDARGPWTLLDCNILCCRTNRCNYYRYVSLPLPPAAPSTTTGAMPKTADEPANAGYPSYYSPTSGVVAIAATIVGFLLLI